MSKTRDNHYVPEWYQRGFLFNQKVDRLHYLDFEPYRIALPNGTNKEICTPRLMPPAKCFFETDLYTTFVGSDVNDDIERFLFGNIDTRGARAVRAFIGNGYSEWHHCFLDFFYYIDAQKIRTPKGLRWIREHYPQLNQLNLMIEMQAIRTMHCTLWSEAVREIVSAKNSQTKFILTDHPVTFYNPAHSPDSPECRYPNDPSIALKGTQTVFPLDKDHCLVLTNYEYAKAPGTENPTEKRTYARNFRDSLIRTNVFIKSRELAEHEVVHINYLLKSRARRFIGAAKQEWLYPERSVKPTWTDIGKVLLPPEEELWHFGGEIYVGYESGRTQYQDAFGRTQPENKYLKKPKAAAEPGRNDPCGCGSGLKYKKCCLNKTSFQRPSWEELSIRERNIILATGIREILGLADGKTWEDVRRELSSDQVKEIHQLYGSLWPLETDVFKLLPKPDGRLRALYSGIVDVRTIGSSVTSLVPYIDEILVETPFINPWMMRKEYSPIDTPDQFKAQTLKNVLLLLALMPSINAGYINLFPDPCAFDRYLLQQMFTMAEERHRHNPFSTKDEELTKQLFKDDFERNMWMLPKDAQKQQIKRALPHLTDEEIGNTLEHITRKRHADPLALLQDDTICGSERGQVIVSNMSPNFEMSLFIAQATGALLITDNRTRWEEMTRAQNRTNGVINYPWNDLTSFIKGKEQVLNTDERANFALRKSGKLQGLRSAMRHIYNAVTTTGPNAGTVDRLKQGFEMACSGNSTKIDERENGFKASFECLIPEGGIVHNNVQRLLLSSEVQHHTNSVPMVILVSQTAL